MTYSIIPQNKFLGIGHVPLKCIITDKLYVASGIFIVLPRDKYMIELRSDYPAMTAYTDEGL